MIGEFFNQLGDLLTLTHLAVLVGAVLLGIVFGVLPGLTATLGVALLTAVTFNLTQAGSDPGRALQLSMLALIGIYVGAIYGGSHPALLLNIPGTAASAATALEGQALCRQGRGGEAIATATVASTAGTIIGLLAMLLIIPLLQLLAERSFTSVEYFLLAIFGVLICGSLTSPDTPLKGWIAGVLGLLLSTVGLDAIMSYPRFTFGSADLAQGIKPIPVILGGFAIPQIIRTLRDPAVRAEIGRVMRVIPDFGELKRNVGTVVRSGLTGVAVGSIPGVGEDVAAWMSYDMAKKSSREPEQFGQGSMKGVIAAETANNACIGGALVPLLTLGIPGSPPAAMLLGAIMLHNVIPGPMLAKQNPSFMPMMCAILLLASLAVLVCGILMTKVTVRVLRMPAGLLMPLVALFTVIGAFALHNRMIDVTFMFGFGIAAYFLEEMGYPIAPLVIAIILGPMADENIRRALMAHHGSVAPFFTRPVAIILLALIVYSLVSQTPWFRSRWDRMKSAFRRG